MNIKSRHNKLTKTLFFAMSASLMVLMAGNLTSCNKTYDHEVSLKSNCLELVGDSIAKSNANYTCSFKIKDDVISSRYMDNIDLDTMSASVDGKDLPVDAFSFIYQTNAKNTFTIQKQYLTGKVEIKADLAKRTQKQNCFFFEFDLDDYVEFTDIKISYPATDKQMGKEGVDSDKTKTKDNIFLKENCDVAKILKTDPHEKFGDAYNLLILREDNAFKMDIKSKNDKPLPKNIWFRSNARFTKKGEDFTITYSDDYKSASIEVPYFFIRDNGSFRLNPDVKA